MKHLIWKLVLPLTAISFLTITKWWYAIPIDAAGTVYSGFPLPFVANGWHTSLSLQIFILEMLADILVYFLFWLLVVYLVNRFWLKIKMHKIVTILLLSISAIMVFLGLFIATMKNNIFYLNCPYPMEIKATGYKFLGQRITPPEE